MFCSQCGVSASGKFCWSCGNQLQVVGPATVSPALTDWAQSTNYETLIRIPEVRERIARHAARAKKRLSGEQFLEICDNLMSPLTGGVPLTAIAAITQPLTEKLGLKTGNARAAVFQDPPGAMIVAVLCSLAQNNQSLIHVRQATDGCVIEAQLPSDMWSLAGELEIAIRSESRGTLIEAAATIKGQYYDWGKSRRAIEQIFRDLTAVARAA